MCGVCMKKLTQPLSIYHHRPWFLYTPWGAHRCICGFSSTSEFFMGSEEITNPTSTFIRR